MRKVQRWRYYCEYCKKSGGSAYHMEMHEKGCTNNPHRVCGMCRNAGLKQAGIKHLIGALGIGDKEGMDKLRELSKGCPACMLAALRQSGVMEPPDYDPECPGDHIVVEWPNFDFREAKKEFWAGVKDEADHQREIEETFYAMGASYGDGF